MKTKKIKFLILICSVLFIFLGLDVSINAKDLNVFQGASLTTTPDTLKFTFSPSVLYLLSVGFIGIVVVGRGNTSQDSRLSNRRTPPESQ